MDGNCESNCLALIVLSHLEGQKFINCFLWIDQVKPTQARDKTFKEDDIYLRFSLSPVQGFFKVEDSILMCETGNSSDDSSVLSLTRSVHLTPVTSL